MISKRFKFSCDYKAKSITGIQLAARNKVIERINNQVYKFETNDCFCGGSKSTLISETDYFGLYYPLVLCQECGILRANPRMDQSSFNSFYAEEYRALYGDENFSKEELWNIRMSQGIEIYNYIKCSVNLEHNSTIVDIGCNMGSALVPFSQDGHFVYGVDFNCDYLEFGKRKSGISNLYAGDAQKLLSLNVKADVIILSHVLEHFLDLDRELDSLSRILKPGGHLYVALPGTFSWIEKNCGGDIKALLQNAHTYQFSLSSLSYVMGCHGYELTKGDERIISIYRKTGKFLNKSSRPASEAKLVFGYLENLERVFKKNGFRRNMSWLKRKLFH